MSTVKNILENIADISQGNYLLDPEVKMICGSCGLEYTIVLPEKMTPDEAQPFITDGVKTHREYMCSKK